MQLFRVKRDVHGLYIMREGLTYRPEPTDTAWAATSTRCEATKPDRGIADTGFCWTRSSADSLIREGQRVAALKVKNSDMITPRRLGDDGKDSTSNVCEVWHNHDISGPDASQSGIPFKPYDVDRLKKAGRRL